MGFGRGLQERDIIEVTENNGMKRVGLHAGEFMFNKALRAVALAVLLAQSSPAQPPAEWPIEPPVRGQSQSLDISLTNLGAGTYVSRVFQVQGQTAPYSNVVVSAPEFVNSEGEPLAAGAAANASGRFSVRFDASCVPPHSQLLLQVQAMDREGRRGPVCTVEVMLR